MKSALVLASMATVIVWLAGCGGAGPRSRTERAAPTQPPPVAPCSLLTARQASAVLGVRVHVHRSLGSCAYQGTSEGVFRSVVVTPLHLAATPLVPFNPKDGRIVQIQGPGYRGEAQNASPRGGASGLAQSKAQLVMGDIVVRVFVTYHTGAPLGVPQLPETLTLARAVGKRLATAN